MASRGIAIDNISYDLEAAKHAASKYADDFVHRVMYPNGVEYTAIVDIPAYLEQEKLWLEQEKLRLEREKSERGKWVERRRTQPPPQPSPATGAFGCLLILLMLVVMCSFLIWRFGAIGPLHI